MPYDLILSNWYDRKEAEELVDVKEKFLDWLGYEPSEKGSLIRGNRSPACSVGGA
jgi:hypothetical protein